MLRAEIAHVTCEQIARGGLTRVEGPIAWREPPRYSGESEETYAARKCLARVRHLDAEARATEANIGNRETCARAVEWLRDAGDHAAAEAVRAHMRQQWGRFAAQEAA